MTDDDFELTTEDYRRIDAAIKVCDGLSTEELEAMEPGSLRILLEESERRCAQ